jgi:hypothetical protein
MGASFLIGYDGQHHYPKDIQIRNINGSGYDYDVSVNILYGVVTIWV